MRKLAIKISNRVGCIELNEAIEETGVQIERGVSLLTYRQTCELARIASDGEHEFPTYVEHFLEDVVDMWEHWNEPGYTIETVGTYKGVKLSFVD